MNQFFLYSNPYQSMHLPVYPQFGNPLALTMDYEAETKEAERKEAEKRAIFIRDCIQLADMTMPNLYAAKTAWTFVETKPTVVLVDSSVTKVAIWGKSLSGFTQCVKMSLPTLRDQLRELAESGAAWTDYLSVRFQFVPTGSAWAEDPADWMSTMSFV
ncbi:hypothetical protein FZEAL_9512 [Fusarium zealandicum]|uniref:Uncharacterized protein n=1 Tax=Fusarium zealandicum TaxID=1053134 RepID=A0A8H4UAG0_9HYPO|nr:hypothetical protein FZEAL_9512 [Fusarium zealandicum]